MTLEELVTSANNGDINAMMKLGKYYMDKDETDDAIKWCRLAAEKGLPIAMWLVSIQYYIKGLTEEQFLGTLYGPSEILPSFENAYYWAKKFFLFPDQGITGNIDADTITEKIQEYAYHTALYSYSLDNHKDALLVADDMPNDSRSGILRGVLAVETDDSDTAKTFQLLSCVLNHSTYGEVQKSPIEEMVYLNAALYLSTYYRKGIVGSPDLASAVKVLHFVSNYIKDKDFLDAIQREIQRYQPKLFGGYRYIG